MTRSLAASISDCAFDAGQAAVDTAVTISARIPILSSWFVSPSAESLAEWQVACTEKMAALWDTGVAAALGVQDLALRSLVEPFTPFGAAQEAVVLVRAINRPGQVAVRENAERFGRG